MFAAWSIDMQLKFKIEVVVTSDHAYLMACSDDADESRFGVPWHELDERDAVSLAKMLQQWLLTAAADQVQTQARALISAGASAGCVVPNTLINEPTKPVRMPPKRKGGR